MTCECKICSKGRKLNEVAEKLGEEDKQVIKDLLDDWVNESFEAEWYKMKYEELKKFIKSQPTINLSCKHCHMPII